MPAWALPAVLPGTGAVGKSDEVPTFPVRCRGRFPPDLKEKAPMELLQPRTAEQVFHEHAARVYSLARRMLGNDADAEDVTQEVLLQVVRKLSTFRGEARLATWLHRVTVNAALAHRRQQSRRPECHLDCYLDYLARPGSARAEEGPAGAVMGLEARQRIEQAIAALPPLYRDVYVLADIEGLGIAQIGGLLSLGLAAVKSRLHRARLRLRAALAPHFPGGCCDWRG
jgi:RNA polymerase sigma-70 factor (ECF subfamily)